jgi:hypothetical protein
MKTIILFIVAFGLTWAVLFGISFQQRHYSLSFERENGVSFHNDPVR